MIIQIYGYNNDNLRRTILSHSNLFRYGESSVILFHKLDETIRGHVFCSYLAQVLRKEPDKRLEKQGMDYEWNDIKQELTALREVTRVEDQLGF